MASSEATGQWNTSRLRSVDLKDEKVRLLTFKNWPVTFISKTSLAKAGFYYLNKDDVVKCAYCSGVIAQWENGDDPFREHKKFFATCPKVLAYENNQDDDDIGVHTAKPKSPNFSTLESRIRSYGNWKKADVQKPESLSNAGFYYLGFDDEVRCFYCDGGLRFWLKEDDPFFEHARYFPKCSFVQLVKGKSYVDNVLELAKSRENSEISGQSESTVSRIASATMTIDEAMNSETVNAALALGLDVGRIKSVTQRKLNMTGTSYTELQELIEDVLDDQISDEGEGLSDRNIENQVTRLLLSAVSSVDLASTSSSSNRRTSQSNASATEDPPATESTSTEETKSPNDSLSLEEENKRLKSARECKICMTEEVAVVFVPCGHLLSCVMCSTALENCPLCRSQIKGRVRTFLS